MRLFCHLCKKLAFRDTCGKCRKVIDAHYENSLRLMRTLREAGIAEVKYVLMEQKKPNTKQWRH